MMTKKCLMPDIAGLDPSAVGCYIVSRLAGAGSHDRVQDSLVKSAARLIDKAMREYSFAREAIVKEISENELSFDEIQKRGTGQYMYAMVIIDHFENCINALARTYHLLKPNVKTNEIITKMRNSIEHADERIKEETAGPLAVDVSENASSVRIFFRPWSKGDEKLPAKVIELRTKDLAREIRKTYNEVRSQI